ncbi:DUF58 domain-containing protein [Haloflavibacter putidus]|uniref:DUF58 domain-containing protein n=1 Tax=Haloflavibacter putidus TaxID=2576776 RepID=A0A507ZRN7_9FLAO|nr:DUF58 domain-containing protein [Haloflavibacter putidus]TQD40466.1 DUF58 domain-containing protein [Haloflavibacter putidus]
MQLKDQLSKTGGFAHIDLLAKQVVEGFISGMHKSPFHGFSAEFAEHKIYNPGESTKHIDWKLYAKTDKLYTKRYEEETNLRCHLIVDNSSSMHYPKLKQQNIDKLNKIGFSALACAALMQLLKKQRDAVGLSMYSEDYEFYAPEKAGDRHHHLLLDTLEKSILSTPNNKETKTYTYLHQITQKLKRRSLVFLFTDMLQSDVEEDKLFDALSHLKYNKHEVVLFHTYHKKTELDFDFDNAPKKFLDVESGESINLYAENIQENYQKAIKSYFEKLRLRCIQYKIKYVPVAVEEKFNKILTTYLIERQKFV